MNKDLLERVEALIKKGERVLQTHEPNPPNVIGFPTLDSGLFNEWRAQVLTFLTQAAGSGHVYTGNYSRD